MGECSRLGRVSPRRTVRLSSDICDLFTRPGYVFASSSTFRDSFLQPDTKSFKVASPEQRPTSAHSHPAKTPDSMYGINIYSLIICNDGEQGIRLHRKEVILDR